MATGRLNLTRDQLATFLKNHEQIKQFENLFSTVDTIAPSTDTSQIELLVVEPGVQQNNAQASDYVDFRIAPYAQRIRRVAWDTGDQTLAVGMDYGVEQTVGMSVYARVENSTGVTIPKGTVVGFSGAGPGNVLKHQGVPPFAETRHYIERVMARYVEYHQKIWQNSPDRGWFL